MKQYHILNSILLSLLAAALLSPFPARQAYAEDTLAAANLALQQGRVQEASRMLKETLATQPSNSYAHQLLCRVYYAQEMASRAVDECTAAANASPNDSTTQLWLGQAYGLKASQANPFAAIGLAHKTRLSFEQAVRLDPANVAAASALGEFYVAAPAIVGGGLDKAERLVQTLQQHSPAQAHRLRGLIAEKRGDLSTAEAEFKQAILASHAPQAYVDLALFYQHQKRPDQAVAALQEAYNADHQHDAALVDVASILTALHRSPDLAERALRAYLESSDRSEAAPAFKAYLQLGRLLEAKGNSVGARREYAQALSLAPDYPPARKAAQGG